jgi:putative ABC transport system permease protein
VKFLPLIWAGLRRKSGRSILILAQVIIAFTLFGVLQGLTTGIKQAVNASHADRLYVSSRLRMGAPLPIAVMARLQEIPGVVATAFRFPFGGTYQNSTQGIPVVATDVDSFVAMYPEIKVDPAQVRALRQTQDGVIVGGETMRKYGWKVGQRITLQSPLQRKDGTRNWAFDILGSFENSDQPDSALPIIANYRYVSESLPAQSNTIALATVRIADPTHASQIEQAIDSQFANSSNETLTQSEHELAQSQVASLGDLDTLAHRITGAAFFVLLFATGALMMQSFRERTAELAVLKTVGFSDSLVMAMILAETALLCVGGAAIGLWIATRILVLARSYIGVGSVPAVVAAMGFAFAFSLALAGGAIPAWSGLRLRVVDALRR